MRRMPLGLVVFSMLGAGCPAGDDGESGASATDGTSSGTMSTTDPTTTMSTTDPTTTASTSMSTTTDPATTDPATTDVTTDATTDPATTDPSDTTMDPGTETDPSESTGTPSDPCEVTDMDSECDSCVKTMCCDQLTACEDDPECVCFQDCAGSMEPSIEVPNICAMQCMIDQPFAHPTVGQVLSCSNGCILQCL